MPHVKAHRFQRECDLVERATVGSGRAYAAIGSQPDANQWRLVFFSWWGTEGIFLYTSELSAQNFDYSYKGGSLSRVASFKPEDSHPSR